MGDTNEQIHDLVVVGAGPAGLAVANAAKENGLDCLIIERGAVANSVLNFPTNMKFFSTANLIELADVPLIIRDDKPSRTEALNYYRRFAEVKNLPIDLYRNVEDIERSGEFFDIRTTGRRGDAHDYRSRNIVLSTGAYDNPRKIGVLGEDLDKVTHYYKEPHPYFRQKVLIVGGRNSAAEAALEIWRNGGEVTISYRGPAFHSMKYWVQPDLENRVRSGEIRALMNSHVKEIRPSDVVLEVEGREVVIENDFVLILTGYEPDTSLFDRVGIQYDPVSKRPKMNPETFESNIPGIYLAGVICAGNISGEIFIENSRCHGEPIVDHILNKLGRSE